MPEYLFHDKNTGKEWKEWMSISERSQYLEDNPHIEQLVFGCPPKAVDPMKLMGTNVSRPSSGFNDILKEVKKKHPLGEGIRVRGSVGEV